jgi:drug/metabolite transporter (DMT)-like permease
MSPTPIARGSWFAIGAAVLFGGTAPLVKYFGAAVGAFATACLLYSGAALAASARFTRRSASEEPRLPRSQVPRLFAVALFGAALAPAALAWGLQGAGALAASLLLNLEAVFTVALAWAFYREPLGRRVAVAAAFMALGGALLALRLDATRSSTLLPLLAVAGAMLSWALDNTLTRPLADFELRTVVLWKSALGAGLSAVAAILLGDAWPAPLAVVALLLCGAAGYGLSLRLYLQAQRVLGVARTGSLFALAPFVGAGIAFASGDRSGAPLIALSGGLFAVGVYLHVTEAHRHLHRHEALEHDHAHTHDDGHHLHEHDPPVSGSHSHPHRHDAVEHEHPHGADLHHRHSH